MLGPNHISKKSHYHAAIADSTNQDLIRELKLSTVNSSFMITNRSLNEMVIKDPQADMKTNDRYKGTTHEETQVDDILDNIDLNVPI